MGYGRFSFLKVCPTSTFRRRKYGYVNVPYGHILNHEKSSSPRNIIGGRLKKLRRSALPRISQEDLCGRVARYGVSLTRTQIAKIESGRRPVMDYELAAFARALQVELVELFPQEKKQLR